MTITICLSFTAFAGWSTMASYRIPCAYREQIESGIEQWLKQEPKYHNYDEWKNLVVVYDINHPKCSVDTVRLNKFIIDLKKNNYFTYYGVEHKGYFIYDPQTSIHYSIMVLNWMGFYVAGLDVCVIDIRFSDGRFAGLGVLSDAEIKYALANFKKNILPQIKKYVRLAQKKE